MTTMTEEQQQQLAERQKKLIDGKKSHGDFLWHILSLSPEALSSDPVGEGWYPFPDLPNEPKAT